MRKYFLIALIIITVAGLILAGCAKTTTTTQVVTPTTTAAPSPTTTTPSPTTTTAAAPTGTPIKIGTIVSLTGQSSQTGPPQVDALKYRLNLIGNQILGHPIQLIVADDASDPTTGVDAAKKLLLNDQVDVIIGPTNGAAAVAAGNFMKTASPAIPTLITMAKSSIVITNNTNSPQFGNNVYLPMGTDKSTGWFTGLYAADKLGYKTATTILEDMVSGWDKVGSAVTAFQKEGGKSIQQQAIPSGTTDFSSYLAALKPADCVLVWLTPGPMSRFVQQYYAAGKTMPLIIPDASVLFTKTMMQIGDQTLGIVAEVNYTTLIDTQMNKDWVAGFTKAMGYTPTIQGASSDQNLLLYLEALKLTGGDTTPAKVNDALLKVKVDTPAGTVSFNNQRLGIGDLYIAKSVKVPDSAVGGARIDWQVLDVYKQVLLDIPPQ